MSRTQRENIFAQSAFPKPIWDKVIAAFDMYEEGNLKDQKLSKKALIALPEIKQHHFQPLCHLPIDIQHHLIDQVIDESISLREMKEQAHHARQNEVIKRAFLKLTNKQSWEEATESFPSFTQDDKLEQFHDLDFKSTIPDPFRTFCQSALNSLISPATTWTKTTALGHRITVVPTTIHEATSENIQEIDNKYAGADLILINTSKVERNPHTESNLDYTLIFIITHLCMHYRSQKLRFKKLLLPQES